MLKGAVIFAYCVVSLFAHCAFGQSSSLNLQLPSAPSSYASDKFRTGDLDCSNAIGGSETLEFGVTGLINDVQSPFESESLAFPQRKNVGVYARIVIPLNAPKERINCNTLYRLELRKKQLEVMKLEQELENLRNLQSGGFEN